MIPSFSLRNIDFSAGNYNYNGAINFIHILQHNESENQLHGVIAENGKEEHPVYATFKCMVIDKSLRIIGNNDVDKRNFNILLTPIFGVKKAQLKIEGNYGTRIISSIINLEFNNIKIEGAIAINGKEYLIDLIFGASIMNNNFTITGINKLDKKIFNIIISPKLGVGAKCKIAGSYGARMIPSTIIPLGGDVITQILEMMKSFIINPI